MALVGFIAGAISVTLAFTGLLSDANEPPFFAVGITAMIFSFRFWNMQVRNGSTAVTFSTDGITISNRSSNDTIAWGDLEGIRYKVWRGGHYWEFKSRKLKQTVDFYVDGLGHSQLEEMRQVVASIKRPDVVIETFYNPLGLKLGST